MANTKRKTQEIYDDEIDLTPYIERAWSRKWFIVAITVVAAVVGYLGSNYMENEYEIRASLVFSGEKRVSVTNEDGKQIEEIPIVATSYVASLLESFNNNYENDAISSSLKTISTEKAGSYPIELTFTVAENDDASKYTDAFLEYLTGNSCVKDEVAGAREDLEDQIAEREDLIETIEKDLSSPGMTKSSESYADLLALKSNLSIEKMALEEQLSEINGFSYSVDPYFSNNGNPVAPNKTQNGLVAGFGAGILSLLTAAFVPQKKKK